MTIITPESWTEQMEEGIRMLETGLEKVSNLKNRLVLLVSETENTDLLNDAEYYFDELLMAENTNGIMRHEIGQWLKEITSSTLTHVKITEEGISIVDKIFHDLSLMKAVEEKLNVFLDTLWDKHLAFAS